VEHLKGDEMICKKCKYLEKEKREDGSAYCSHKDGYVPRHVIVDNAIDNFCILGENKNK
jgi:hypothetical protein